MSKLLHSEQQSLHDWAVLLVQLFNGEMCYHVGSSLSLDPSPTYRDVDIRTMLDSKDFKVLASVVDIDRLNLAVSLWGQRATGLPIDFQIQDTLYANEHHSGPRSAVGIGGIARGDGRA